MPPLLDLPTELIQEIFSGLDALSNIYLRASCKTLGKLVGPTKLYNAFTLHEGATTHELPSINHFVNHIYECVVTSDIDQKTYHLLRKPAMHVVFKRKRVRNKYNYVVAIEDHGVPVLVITYDGKMKRFRCTKTFFGPIDMPCVLYMSAIRYMKKIYKEKPIDYNFDETARVPCILRKMLNKSYDGALVPEVINGNFTL